MLMMMLIKLYIISYHIISINVGHDYILEHFIRLLSDYGAHPNNDLRLMLNWGRNTYLKSSTATLA